jgi:hypothetical protein
MSPHARTLPISAIFISSGFLFALETAQGAKFDAGKGMDGRHPILNPMDVQAAMDEINLLPAQRA